MFYGLGPGGSSLQEQRWTGGKCLYNIPNRVASDTELAGYPAAESVVPDIRYPAG